MKQFYQSYPQLLQTGKIVHAASGELPLLSLASIVHAVRGQSDTASMAAADWQPGTLHPHLSWTHYRTLLRVGRTEARDFYEIESTRNAWSARELERQINSLLFDRLAKSRDKAGLIRLTTQGHEITQPIDVLKDPLVLEFLDLPESPRLVESKLEQALIGNLQKFLLELGKGFAFVSRQERITLDGDHFYIDLVFYHTVLKCFVLIDRQCPGNARRRGITQPIRQFDQAFAQTGIAHVRSTKLLHRPTPLVNHRPAFVDQRTWGKHKVYQT